MTDSFEAIKGNIDLIDTESILMSKLIFWWWGFGKGKEKIRYFE